MASMRTAALAAVALLVGGVPHVPAVLAAGPSSRLTVPGFGEVSIYAPRGAPSQVVLFISGDGGWTRGVVPMAESLRERGALVAGIDIRTFLRTLDHAHGCAYPAGDLEALSRTVQLTAGLAAYRAPILVGYSSGATMAYAALAAAPPETFAGAVSLGFCPDLHIRTSPCEQNGLLVTRRTRGTGFDLRPGAHLEKPWMVLQGSIDRVCSAAETRQFVAATPNAHFYPLPQVGHGFAVDRQWHASYLAAYDAVAADNDIRRDREGAATATSPDVRDLSLVEVPAAGIAKSDTMAVILTGDGGWADLDRSVAAALARRGVPSVGWSSLRYYWTPRTPERAAADLARIIAHYQRQWGTPRVRLVGYSFGADVLPFLVSRLPPDVKSHVASVALLGLWDRTSFEFDVTDWITTRATPYLTVPEVERLQVPVLCVSGSDERESACHAIRGTHTTVLHVGRGHHFGGDYDRLANAIVS